MYVYMCVYTYTYLYIPVYVYVYRYISSLLNNPPYNTFVQVARRAQKRSIARAQEGINSKANTPNPI